MRQLTKKKRTDFFIETSVVVLSLAAFLCVFGQAARAERLPVTSYTVADGLLRDNVQKIRQDARGFLWICTAEGISRFDGAAMTNFTVADGLPDRFVYDFLETRGGAVYIATGKGLARLNPRGFRSANSNFKSQISNSEQPLFTVILPDDGRAAAISVLLEDRRGQVWAGTSNGLYKLNETDDETRLEAFALAYSKDKNLPVTEIIEDWRGSLWIGTEHGLFRLAADGTVTHLTIADGLADNNVASLLADRAGQIWTGLRPGIKGGLCILDAESAAVKKCYSQKDGLPAAWIPDLIQTGDGKIWAATVGGLCLWQNGSSEKSVCKTYTAKNGLCDTVFTLAEDRDGNLWTGSECGAKKIARYGFMTYGEADGLSYAGINSIFENRAGELFVSTNVGGRRLISRFDRDKFSTVAPRFSKSIDYLGWGWNQIDWQDTSGAWWIPTGRGLFRSPDNTSFDALARAPLETVEKGLKVEPPELRKRELTEKYRQSKLAEMKFYEVFRLFEDSRGDIWIATIGYQNNLLRWERAKNVWHDYTNQVGLTSDRLVSAFVEDRYGSVWIGTGSDDAVHYYEGLLVRYRAGEFQKFTDREGAPRGWVRDLFSDSAGRLWIASTEDGLLRLDETNTNELNFVRYTPANGLTSSATASVTEDEFGRIYVGTWRGIDRLDPETGQIENFTTADGLPGSFISTAHRDQNNNLWFAASRSGVARFQPEPPRKRKPPVILITGLRVRGVPQMISILGETEIAALDLSFDQNQIEIDFLGLGASLGEKLDYEYRLGDSDDWTPTAEKSVNFANLAAGEYRFEVRTRAKDRIYSPSPAAVSFKIATPVWRQLWFIVAAALILFFVFYLVYRSRLKRLLEIERTRTRIATDLHDDIGANLSKISMMSEIAKLQTANGGAAENQRLLTSIAETARESVSAMSDIVWAISPQRDTVLELTRKMRRCAEDAFVPADVELEFNAPADGRKISLSMDTRRELYLIFKESVNNAARHSDARKVKIDFWVETGEIFLQIADDGRGFDLSQSLEGNGLTNMRSRAERIGGTFEVASAPGNTVIKVTIPQK